MCLLIVNAGQPLTRDIFTNAWDNNPHGGGLVYIGKSGRLKVKKTMKGAHEFFKMYEAAKEESPASNMLVHFRWATHGSKTIDNTHPFKINSGLYFAHNGILSDYGSVTKNVSDTRDFGEKVLSKMGHEFYLDEYLLKMLEKVIGSGNKIALLDHNNEYAIINESAGSWKDGNWFSNFGYLPRTYRTYTYDTCKSTTTKGKRGKTPAAVAKNLFDKDTTPQKATVSTAPSPALLADLVKPMHTEYRPLVGTAGKSYYGDHFTKTGLPEEGMWYGGGNTMSSVPSTFIPESVHRVADAMLLRPAAYNGRFVWVNKKGDAHYSKDYPAEIASWQPVVGEKL